MKTTGVPCKNCIHGKKMGYEQPCCWCISNEDIAMSHINPGHAIDYTRFQEKPHTGEKYLCTFMCEGEFYSCLKTMQEIANMVGFRDCDPCMENLRIYRIFPDKVQPLDYADYHHRLEVCLFDENDVEIDSANYADH